MTFLFCFVGPCIGFATSDDVPNRWICDSCSLRLQLLYQKSTAAHRLRRLTNVIPIATSNHDQDDFNDVNNPTAKHQGGDDSADMSNNEVTLPNRQTGIVLPNSILRQILINYLTTESNKEVSIGQARQYLLAQWLSDALTDPDDAARHNHNPDENENEGDEENSESARKPSVLMKVENLESEDVIFCVAEWQAFAATNNNILSTANGDTSNTAMTNGTDNKAPTMARESVIRATRQCSSGNSYAKSYIPITHLLLMTCNSAVNKLRAASVKALSDVIRIDDNLMKSDQARHAIMNLLEDHAISTRAGK
jgi:hypothetical protein